MKFTIRQLNAFHNICQYSRKFELAKSMRILISDMLKSEVTEIELPENTFAERQFCVLISNAEEGIKYLKKRDRK